VLEASDHIGGRARILRRRSSADFCDVGTQYYHSNYVRALDLTSQAGLGTKVRKIAGDTRFFDERTPAGSFLVGHRLPWFRPAGIGGNLRLFSFLVSRLLRHPMSTFALEHHPELDDVRAMDVIRDPVLREFMVRVLANVGTLADPETSGVSLLQVLRLLRIIVLTDYLGLPGGVVSLHEALASALEVEREKPVQSLIWEGGCVRGVVLEGSGEALAADHVVVATPAPAAATMLPEDWTTERSFLANVRFPPALIVTLFLDRPLEKGVWSYVVQAERVDRTSFCTDASQKVPEMIPSGKGVLQAWICHPRSESAIAETDTDVIRHTLAELEPHFPGLGSWVEEAYVTRHAGGTPQHDVGHHGRALAFLQHADARPGVSFVGDYFSGGYLEPALWSAERATRALSSAQARPVR
jgi:protoporphyrinogen/coproporphyrinogen III oxidase